ncbi:MAG: sulfotransferase [Erythrobacter sp.]|nr:sulfotransferase [Erythrobacter sp.]
MPEFDPEYLWNIGSRGYGAQDEVSIRDEEDVADFRLRLEVLCRSLREEAQLNALGHTMAYGQITSAIRKRHALGKLWREQPELARTEIAPPIVVLGQMRSGTTRVQRLLAADPRFCGTRFCNSQDPVPASPDLRPVKARVALAIAHAVNPWLEAMHPFGATRVDEEIGWLAAALSPAAFEAQWRIPSFVAFSEARDASPVYREFARILRTDAAAMANADRPRVLKCPQFAEDMAALIAVFPDARVIACERDSESVLASSVSMVASQMAFQSDLGDVEALEAEWRRKMDLRARRIDAFSADPGAVAAKVHFDALNEDPIAALADAYSALGKDFAPHARSAAESELQRASRDGHGQHRRQLENFAS